MNVTKAHATAAATEASRANGRPTSIWFLNHRDGWAWDYRDAAPAGAARLQDVPMPRDAAPGPAGPATAVILTTADGEKIRTTLGAFLAENDGFDADEIAAMGEALDANCGYDGGGGAAPEWSIRRA